jgi:hypothetical protein
MQINSKKIILLYCALIIVNITSACPVCERNQPKILRGIVHGAGPENSWDYISVWITIIITLITLYYTIKWIAKPGETNEDHIKYSIFK